MRITLGTACLSDLDLIHVIRRDAILGVPAGAGLRDCQAWADSRSPSFYADRLTAGQVVLARVAGEAIGWGSSADAWITGLYVRAAWSRRGIGRTLMARLEMEIAQRGHACVRLAASPNAVDFYTKLGYAPCGLADGEGAVPMTKRLRPADPPARLSNSAVAHVPK